jgi:hypothetical protein
LATDTATGIFGGGNRNFAHLPTPMLVKSIKRNLLDQYANWTRYKARYLIGKAVKIAPLSAQLLKFEVKQSLEGILVGQLR